MNLVAKLFNSRFPEEFPNGVYDVAEYNPEANMLWIYHGDSLTNFDCNPEHEKCEASIHISTGMLDKNGREILVGLDVCGWIDGNKIKGTILYDGNKHFVKYEKVVFTNTDDPYEIDTVDELTPELAKTLEVMK